MDAEYNAAEEKTYVDSKRNTGNTARKSRTRLIMIGVVAAVIVLAVVIVVVVVVTQKKNGDESEKKNECGPFTLPGVNFSDLSPTIISRSYTCPLKGDCWTGEKCYECFKLETWKVGNINNIPVCCPNCIVSGLAISNSECNCRYNGR